MVQRLTYRRRKPYNTSSNRRRISKTPGGRLVYLNIKKVCLLRHYVINASEIHCDLSYNFNDRTMVFVLG